MISSLSRCVQLEIAWNDCIVCYNHDFMCTSNHKRDNSGLYTEHAFKLTIMSALLRPPIIICLHPPPHPSPRYFIVFTLVLIIPLVYSFSSSSPHLSPRFFFVFTFLLILFPRMFPFFIFASSFPSFLLRRKVKTKKKRGEG